MRFFVLLKRKVAQQNDRETASSWDLFLLGPHFAFSGTVAAFDALECVASDGEFIKAVWRLDLWEHSSSLSVFVTINKNTFYSSASSFFRSYLLCFAVSLVVAIRVCPLVVIIGHRRLYSTIFFLLFFNSIRSHCRIQLLSWLGTLSRKNAAIALITTRRIGQPYSLFNEERQRDLLFRPDGNMFECFFRSQLPLTREFWSYIRFILIHK